MNGLKYDYTGKRFGSLYIVKRAPNHYNQIMWECECDCGSSFIVRGDHLKRGQQRCRMCVRHDVNIKHGLINHPLYCTWAMMKQRCFNPKASGYHNYGGRGISVCDRWLKFENFVADVGMPPTKTHTLDRFPDKNGDYEPNNVRWATNSEQMLNVRSNRIIDYNGEQRPVSEWSKNKNITNSLIHGRLRLGWAAEDILNKKPRKKIIIEFNNERLTISEWSKKLGVNVSTINNRLRAGKPINEVLNKINQKTKCLLK